MEVTVTESGRRCNIINPNSGKYGPFNMIIEIELSVGIDGVYICKEISMMDLNTKQVMCTTFKPPKNTTWAGLSQAAKTRNIYLLEIVHGIPFLAGEKDYDEFPIILRKICTPYATGICTKGLEKANLLSSILGKYVYNLEDVPGLFTKSDLEITNVEKDSSKRYACFNEHKSSSGRIHCCLNKVYRHKSKLRKYYK